MNVTIIGMPNVGKSIIGKELAKRLNYEFIDTDTLIEKKLNMKLQQVVDEFGEDRFLKIEERTVLKLGELDNCIISPGGSVIYSIKAMEYLKRNSIVVFLNVSFESISERILNQYERGIIGLKKKSLKELFDERLPMYEKYADITIEMPEDFNTDVIINDMIQRIEVVKL